MKGCMYCEMGESVDRLMIPVAELRVSRLFLLMDQSFRGRCVLELRDHYTEVNDIPKAQGLAFYEDLSDSVTAIRKVFHPDKVNYAIIGDLVPHFHVHLVPKYRDGPVWGKPYCAEPVAAEKLGEEEYGKRIESIRKALKTSDLEIHDGKGTDK